MDFEPSSDDRHQEEANGAQARRRRIRRLQALLVLVAAFVLAMVTLLFTFNGTSSLKFGGGAMTLSMLGAAGAMLLYLQPTATSQRNATRAYVDRQIASLTQRLTSSSSPTSEDDRQRSTELLRAQLREGAAELVVSEMRKQAAAEAENRAIDVKATRMEQRLSREITDLARRGNVNLVLGMGTTVFGLYFLGSAVLNSPAALSGTDLVMHFIPRLSFAVVIEVFAYFFLRLYKESLGEIKYFQNELTNLESRAIATQIAWQTNDSELLKQLALTLASTERNFVLERGQSTVELERDRIAQKANDKLLDTLSAALVAKKSD